jgi:hypothetical protein
MLYSFLHQGMLKKTQITHPVPPISVPNYFDDLCNKDTARFNHKKCFFKSDYAKSITIQFHKLLNILTVILCTGQFLFHLTAVIFI